MQIALFLLAGLVLALGGCAAREGSTCDDGGSGGVVIDGVCL